MDNAEATTKLMMRIESLDPDNTCKIMGYILIQDPCEKEMIRLALGPDSLLIDVINRVKSRLGLLSNTSSANSSPSVFNHISNSPRRSLLNQSSPRIIIPTSPLSPWSGFSPKPPASSPSYASAVVNGGSNFEAFSRNNDVNKDSTNGSVQVQAEDQLFLDTKNINIMDSVLSLSALSDSILFPCDSCTQNHTHSNLHRRSFSVSDVYLDGGGQFDGNSNGGWRPCMYFTRGFCKNGSNCKFLHESLDSSLVGSPEMDNLDELVRLNAIQQQRFSASQLMAGAPFGNNRCMNFLNENQRSAAAALMMGEEYHKFGRCRPDRNDFGFVGSPNSSSRQIYLTFPADSTFKEDDVSRYFGTYGPVQDVRIPYQVKRMFGFVTFVYADTVKQILAHGNPHFVCNSRVLVKPYKEKGQIPDKRQQMEIGEFPECLSPSGLAQREPYDLPFGGRVVYNSDTIMLRRKLEEQADLQHAIDCQERRLMNIQLMDLPNHLSSYPRRPHLMAAFPTHSNAHINQNLIFSSDDISQEVLEGSIAGKDEALSPNVEIDEKIPDDGDESGNKDNVSVIGNEEKENPTVEDYDPNGSLEHILPDNLFASPTKSVSECKSLFCAASAESDRSILVNTTSLTTNNVPVPATSTLSMASPIPCFLEMPSH